jgi:1-acyl-sn-glycerol-3-phosphate acyltransferase
VQLSKTPQSNQGAGNWADAIAIRNPGRIAPAAERLVRGLVAPFVRICFRPTLAGIENLPASGPYLLVANHSAGMGIAEILSFAVLYLRDVGSQRPLAGFALPIGFRVFPLSAVLRGFGAIPSTYTAAQQALAAGVPILVFPGGDHETFRPIWQANRVDFGGHVGFLRIASRARVPIVPFGISGSHFTAPILFRSKALAWLLVQPRLIGLNRWAVSLLGVIGAALILTFVPYSWPIRAVLAWLWLGSPLIFLPWIPWKIRMRIGVPIPSSELFAFEGDAENDEQLRQALLRVETVVQTELDRSRLRKRSQG